jgi:hypothetical protein
LILHATLFYFICNTFWEQKHWLSNLGKKTPFFWFLLLLAFNFIWLITISGRLYKWAGNKKRRIFRFYLWIFNNLCFSLYFVWLIFISQETNELYLTMVGFANCLIDIFFTAPDYLEQRNQSKPVLKIKAFELWPRIPDKLKT